MPQGTVIDTLRLFDQFRDILAWMLRGFGLARHQISKTRGREKMLHEIQPDTLM